MTAVIRQGAAAETEELTTVGSDSIARQRVATRPRGLQASYATGLVAELFGTEAVSPTKVVAFVAAGPDEGVSKTITLLAHEVERTTSLRCSTTTAAEMLAASNGRTKLVRPQALRHSLTTELLGESEVILVDAGSLALGDEVLDIARKVDAIVIVVEARKTSRNDASHAVSAITSAGGNVAGLVLYRSTPLPAWLERWVSRPPRIR